jgi:hypothetical protein
MHSPLESAPHQRPIIYSFAEPLRRPSRPRGRRRSRIPFGWAAWIGYLIIGAKSRNWKWIAIAGGFFVFVVITLSVMGNLPSIEKGDSYPEPYNIISNWVISINLIVWIGNAIGLQWWINRKWLVWRARNDKTVSTPWHAT